MAFPPGSASHHPCVMPVTVGEVQVAPSLVLDLLLPPISPPREEWLGLTPSVGQSKALS